jgi:hypothetical protein
VEPLPELPIFLSLHYAAARDVAATDSEFEDFPVFPLKNGVATESLLGIAMEIPSLVMRLDVGRKLLDSIAVGDCEFDRFIAAVVSGPSIVDSNSDALDGARKRHEQRGRWINKKRSAAAKRGHCQKRDSTERDHPLARQIF